MCCVHYGTGILFLVDSTIWGGIGIQLCMGGDPAIALSQTFDQPFFFKMSKTTQTSCQTKVCEQIDHHD